MDFNFSVRHNHRKSTSSSDDHFFPVFSPPLDSSAANEFGGGVDDGLDEDDVFWTGNFAQRKTRSTAATSSFNGRVFLSRSSSRKPDEKFGILAALSDESKFQSLRRNTPLAIPMRDAPPPKFNFSAPVEVPVMSKEMKMKSNARRNRGFVDVDDDEGGDDEMLPPHEIVSRSSALTPNTTFSMLEGAGRTLKGRDLRQVRNAVFRQTGFVD